MVQKTNEVKIVREKMKMVGTRYKSYENKHCKDIEFRVGDHIRGIIRFDQKRRKLSPYFIRPFEILEHVGRITNRLVLPPKM